MAKKCDILGTGVMSGNNVSHANNKTRRRFLPNLQVVSLFSEALNRVFKLKVCSKPCVLLNIMAVWILIQRKLPILN